MRMSNLMVLAQALFGLSGCAIPSRLAATEGAMRPPAHRERHAMAIRTQSGPLLLVSVPPEVDSTISVSRFSVVTHPGRYFLWIQQPRITFYVEGAGQPLTPPETVFLEFRTQTPQEVASSALSITCDGVQTEAGLTPTAEVTQGMLTTSVFQTFALPVDVVRHLASCTAASLTVGGITATFPPANMARLRAFTAALPRG